MRLARRARNILRRNGIEVSRYFAELDWERNFLRQLQSHRVSAVLDVGANSGQYARGLRGAGFAGRIVSFEPLPGPFAVLQRSASTDPLWECRRCALGDVDGTISINVAGNEGASSSVLPMLKRHQDAFPPANYVGAQRVPIHRLDSVAADVLRPNDIAFLKIDVQGFASRSPTIRTPVPCRIAPPRPGLPRRARKNDRRSARTTTDHPMRARCPGSSRRTARRRARTANTRSLVHTRTGMPPRRRRCHRRLRCARCVPGSVAPAHFSPCAATRRGR